MEKRVIKFRCWDSEAKQMVYVRDNRSLRLYDDYSGAIVFNCGESAGGDYDMVSISDENPLMQFTGLLDKHGKEVFEGDIFEFEGWHGGIEFVMAEDALKKEGKNTPDYMERRVILGHPHGHYIMRKLDDITDMTYVGDTLFSYSSFAKDCEIIGNVFENPELLTPLI